MRIAFQEQLSYLKMLGTLFVVLFILRFSRSKTETNLGNQKIIHKLVIISITVLLILYQKTCF